MGILDTAKVARDFDAAKSALELQQNGGPGLWRQLSKILAMRLVGPRFHPSEAYRYGFFRPGFTRARRKTYLSDKGNDTFNQIAATPEAAASKILANDKLVFEREAKARGLAVADTLAVYACPDAGAEAIHLADADEILGFLRQPGRLPLFGKPRNSSHAFGVVSILSISDDGETLRLGNGMDYSARALADEVVQNWASGYLFQRHLFNHAVLRAQMGQATATARVCTVLGDAGPELLYISQRLPSATAMHDNSSVNRRGFAAVDPATGVITRLAVHGRGQLVDLDRWNDASTPLIGVTLPWFQETVALSIAAHRMLPGIAICGSDVVIADAGPVLTEANTNPYHSVFQTAEDQGFLTKSIVERCEKARRLCQMLPKPY